MKTRRGHLSVSFNGVNAEGQIKDYLEDFTFEEISDALSDSMTLNIADKDRKWISSWFPNKGDKIDAYINLFHWDGPDINKHVICGIFTLDDFSFSGTPVKLEMQAVAVPAASSFRETLRTWTYEDTTLLNIASLIAARAGIVVHYEGLPIHIKRVEQSEQDDCNFLNDLCKQHGMNMKIFSDKIVIFDRLVYEAKPPVATLFERGSGANVEPSWSWKTKMCRTYTGAHYEYTLTDLGKTMKIDIGTPERVLSVTDAASTLEEALRITKARLAEANKDDVTMSLTMADANPAIFAGSTIWFAGLGKVEGKYYVNKCTWKVNGTGGVKQSLDLQRVNPVISNITFMGLVD